MVDVFISYRRKSGSTFAGFLQAGLKRMGYSVFFDWYSLMEQGEFREKIDRAIDECTFFLLLLAPGDLDNIKNPEKDWILYEAKHAIERGKIIIPIEIEEGFAFPADCTEPTIEKLSKLEVCSLYGPEVDELIEKRLPRFMKDDPAIQLAKAYNEGIVDPEYIEWERKTLREIYKDIPFVSLFGKEYPVCTVKGSPEVAFPFDALTPAEGLSKTEKCMDYDSELYREFRKIVGPHIHYPDLYGYTSNGFVFDDEGRIRAIRAIPRTYKETVYTCHILKYELWHAYRKLGKETIATLEDLPLRKRIHNGLPNKKIIYSGIGRSALSDVNLALIDYNGKEKAYQIALGIRSENVATHPGYMSIIPAGGFELYELEKNQTEYVIQNNYSVISALYREYLEELYEGEAYEQATGDDDLNRLNKDALIRAIEKGIEKKTYVMEFLGVVFDLTTLRQMISFALRIDDPEYYYDNAIKKNHENTEIKFETLSNLETMLKKSVHPMMEVSAGTISLLLGSDVYKQIADHDFKPVQPANP